MCATSADLHDSVRDFRDPRATQAERDVIAAWWESIGVANQFGAMLRAADIEQAAA